jgi:hypothetical protein
MPEATGVTFTLTLSDQEMQTLRRKLDIGIAYASQAVQDLAATVERQYHEQAAEAEPPSRPRPEAD